MKAAIVESAGKLVVRDLAEPKMGDYEAKCERHYGAVGAKVRKLQPGDMVTRVGCPAVWIDRRRMFALDDINQAFAAVQSRMLVTPAIKLKA